MRQQWEHPFCDVFKLVKIDEWKNSEKRGLVDRVLVRVCVDFDWLLLLGSFHGICPACTQDQTIGKHTYVVRGSIGASNYVQVPRCVWFCVLVPATLLVLCVFVPHGHVSTT